MITPHNKRPQPPPSATTASPHARRRAARVLAPRGRLGASSSSVPRPYADASASLYMARRIAKPGARPPTSTHAAFLTPDRRRQQAAGRASVVLARLCARARLDDT
ncbi:hypothetical protein BV25DRAFT_1825040 [Artomyces pyxidatus]|uniref:Uncharacterized protein n=1 Tax=Artomyces pyxidatus TaxID=48021 RepID=A0ACB8T2B0_9AGAM|nr:hypothetical protein BV25DRAFT_1825040 [Artomyces pyxidatus]